MDKELQIGGARVTRAQAEDLKIPIQFSPVYPFVAGILVQFITIGSSMAGALYYLEIGKLLRPTREEVSAWSPAGSWDVKIVHPALPLNGGSVYPFMVCPMQTVHPDHVVWMEKPAGDN